MYKEVIALRIFAIICLWYKKNLTVYIYSTKAQCKRYEMRNIYVPIVKVQKESMILKQRTVHNTSSISFADTPKLKGNLLFWGLSPSLLEK